MFFKPRTFESNNYITVKTMYNVKLQIREANLIKIGDSELGMFSC